MDAHTEYLLHLAEPPCRDAVESDCYHCSSPG